MRSSQLTFVPTLDIDKKTKRTKKLILDIQNYHIRIKLATYFKDAERHEVPPFMAPPPQKLSWDRKRYQSL